MAFMLVHEFQKKEPMLINLDRVIDITPISATNHEHCYVHIERATPGSNYVMISESWEDILNLQRTS